MATVASVWSRRPLRPPTISATVPARTVGASRPRARVALAPAQRGAPPPPQVAALPDGGGPAVAELARHRRPRDRDAPGRCVEREPPPLAAARHRRDPGGRRCDGRVRGRLCPAHPALVQEGGGGRPPAGGGGGPGPDGRGGPEEGRPPVRGRRGAAGAG